MKRLSTALLAGSLLLAAFPASAAVFLSGDNVSLMTPAGEDLYVSGGTINIRKDVKGDLFIVGATIDVQNSVGRSMSVAGGNVTVVSNVAGTVRVFGGQVTVRGRIDGDLLVFGGAVTVGSDAVVMGNAYVNGGNVILRGVVGKNLEVKGGNVSLEGITHGNLNIRGQNVMVAGPVEGDARLIAERLSVVKGASFKGAVEYWSAGQVDFGDALSGGQQANFRPDLAMQLMRGQKGAAGLAAGLLAALAVFSLLSDILFILIVAFCTRTFFSDAAKEVRKRPWKSFFTGLLFILLMPLLIFLLFLTLIGFPLALAALAGYILTLLFAMPLSAMVAARWTEAYFKKSWGSFAYLGASIGFLVAIRILGIIPLVGWLAKAVIVLLAVGALLQTKMAKWKKIR